MAFNIGTNNLESYLVPLDYFVSGGLWLTGNNNYGQLGNNGTTNSLSFLQTVSGGTNWQQASCGTAVTAAIKTDGTLWLWGINTGGQLGDNTIVSKSSPVQTVSGGTNWLQVQVNGNGAGIIALKSDGTFWYWGGVSSTGASNSSSPIQISVGGNNWKYVSPWTNSTIAGIKTDGSLWLMGQNTYGQLGNNSNTNSTGVFVREYINSTNWKLVSCMSYSTVAMKTDGTIWSTGRNNQGQLGTNDTTSRLVFTQEITSSTNWKTMAGTGYSVMAIKTDGTLWGWGQNSSGQLALNTRVNMSSPTQDITSATNWKSISTGASQAMGIKTDGTLWGWGQNNLGQLGLGNTAPVSSPVQTVSGGNNWRQVSSGSQTAYINLSWGTVQ